MAAAHGSHRVEVPAGLVAAVGHDPAGAAWLAGLPRLLDELLEDWLLQVDGAPLHGRTAVVVPVLTDDGVPAVLKVAHAGPDGRDEILALQTWGGRAAVRLLRGDPHRSAMVLERAGPHDLDAIDDLAACEVVAGLYGRLHVPASSRFGRLTDRVAPWLDDLAGLPARRPHALPRRVVEQAVHVGRALLSDPGSTGTLVHTDLHGGNVLASPGSARGPWLVIDPKPVSGDPHHELAPMLWNRWDEVVASGDVRTAVRRRFHTLVDAAGLDEDRARDWVVVREAVNAMWAADDDTDDAADELTTHLTILKAVQD